LSDRPSILLVPIGRVVDESFKRDIDSVENAFEGLDVKIKRLSPVVNELQVYQLGDVINKEDYDLALLLCLHGATAHLQVAVADYLKLPIVIWSLPWRFSFPTSASAYGALIERGFWATLLHGRPGDKDIVGKIAVLARVAFAIHRLSMARIGILGNLPHYMLASLYDIEAIEKRFGVKLRQLSRFEFTNILGSLRCEEIDMKQISQEKVILKTDKNSLTKGIIVHKAIKEILNRYNLDAIAIGCHPDIEAELQINPCLGFVEDSYAIGCECDVLSLLSALFLKYLSGFSAWITDIYSLEGNLLTLAHCAAASSLAKGGEVVISGKTQKEIGDRPPTLAECRPKIPKGEPATLVRLLGKKANRLHLSFGKIEDCDIEEQVKVILRLNGDPKKFIEYAMGNHYVMALGDLREKLKIFCRRLNIEVIET